MISASKTNKIIDLSDPYQTVVLIASKINLCILEWLAGAEDFRQILGSEE